MVLWYYGSKYVLVYILSHLGRYSMHYIILTLHSPAHLECMGVSKLRRIKRIRRIRRIRRIHILRKIVISKLRRISIIFISLIILKKIFSYSFSHELPPRINIVFSVSNFLSTDNFKKI